MWRSSLVVAVGAISNLMAGADIGSMNGTVTDEAGKAVTGATVYANPVDRPIMGIVPHSTTDKSGHFSINHLSWGVYAVSGAKVDEGYPELLSAFFDRNIVLQKVTLAR